VSRIEALLRGIDSTDALSSRDTWLSRRDPRALILTTLAFLVVVVSFPRHAVAALLPLALYPVVLARLGQIPLPMVATRVLLALPFALMVGIFNPLFDTSPRAELLGQAISGGWLSFASIMVRAALAVAAATVLFATAGMPRICAGLNQIGVPAVVTTQLLLLHRYSLVLAGELGRMNLARELRSSERGDMSLAVYGSVLGNLLIRSVGRAERIHQAMLSRGFNGWLPIRQGNGWHTADTLFVTFCGAAFVAIRATDLATLLGRALLAVSR
jgi:cobalt/nickel transport system permease protein